MIWKPIVEVLILWFVVYHIMLFLAGTRALQVLWGIVILSVASILFQIAHLEILDWLLTKLFGLSILAILIIFHPEIRQGLARLGQRRLFSSVLREEELDYILKEIGKATETLAKEKFGALIAIERNDSLDAYIKSGVAVDGYVCQELIQAIFTPNNPLHDGGLIIQQGRIAASGCIFPLSQNQDLSRVFGTRHRAALGLSEETDAISIIVSEERRDVSLVYRGKLYKDLSREQVMSRAKEIMKMKSTDSTSNPIGWVGVNNYSG
jgi:diadenylate cyclase